MPGRILDSLLKLAFPVPCRDCGKIIEKFADGVACEACWAKTKVFAGNEVLCDKCSEYLRPGKSPFRARCHLCDDHFYDAARAVGPYQRALSMTIANLKKRPFVPGRVRELLAETFVRSGFHDADVMLPVPLSRRRFIERGFNQAEVIAASIESLIGVPIDRHSLIRTKYTPTHRAAMDRRARELTVVKAFEVVRPNLVRDRKVLIIDDVMTSGATASRCAEALKIAGARNVYVLTIARAGWGS